MAEFGVQATELSAPQGAGANVVRPVTAQVDLSGIGNLFKIAGEIQGMKADQERQTVLKEYTTNRDKYAQAIEAGGDLSRINAQRRADAARFRANNPGLIKDFDTVDESFMKNTALSDADEQGKMIRDARKRDIETVHAMGYPVTASTSPATMDSYLTLASTIKSSNAQMEAKMKELQLRSQQFNYDKAYTEEVRRDASRSVLAEVVPAHLTTLNSLSVDMANEISKNPDSYAENIMRFRQTANGLVQQLVGTKEFLPGMFDAFNGMVTEMVNSTEKLLNPTTKSENALKLLQDQNKMFVERAKLVLFQRSPEFANLAATTQTLGDNVLTQLGAIDVVNRYVMPLISPTTSNASVPAISAQTPAEQRQAFPVIAQSITNAVKANTPDSLTQGKKLMEGLLEQANVLDRQENVTVEQIAPIVDFLSDPTTRSKLEALKVAPEKLNGMVGLMERYYYAQIQPAITTAVNQKVKVGGPIVMAGRGLISSAPPKEVKLIDSIVIEPTALGIKVSPKPGSTFNPKGFTDAMVKAVSKGLQAESNLSGQSVEKVWEQRKSFLFPTMFPPEAEEATSPRPSPTSSGGVKLDLSAKGRESLLKNFGNLTASQQDEVIEALKGAKN